MKLFKDLSLEIADTNSYHWNFDRYEEEDGNILAVGYNSLNSHRLNYLRENEETKIILFNNWAPCEYAQRNIKKGINSIQSEDKFDYILTICKYTAKWRNLNSEKRRYIHTFYPFDVGIIPPKMNKKYDAIYHGGIHGREHVMAMRAIMETNYRFSSLDYGINRLTRRYLRHATDINLPFKEKIEKIAECKISICFNLIHVSYKHYQNIMAYRHELPVGSEFFDGLELHHILKNYPWVGVLPQFKTRVHEAAISRCVNLVYRDPWNVIEDYYEKDKEFIYFENEEDLREKIQYILKNWDGDHIQELLESAYQKAMRYTTKNFMKIYSNIVSADLPTQCGDFSDDHFWLKQY